MTDITTLYGTLYREELVFYCELNTSSGIRVSLNDVMIPRFPAVNKVGFLRRFQFRIVAVAGRFVLQSDEEMNEFSQRLENEYTVYFL